MYVWLRESIDGVIRGLLVSLVLIGGTCIATGKLESYTLQVQMVTSPLIQSGSTMCGKYNFVSDLEILLRSHMPVDTTPTAQVTSANGQIPHRLDNPNKRRNLF